MIDGQNEAMTPKMAQEEEPPSTLTVVGVAFASLMDHGMRQDDRVERLIGELRGTYAGLKRADHRLERSRRAHIDALKRVDELEAQIAEAQLETGRVIQDQVNMIRGLQEDVTLRDGLLGRAHRLLVNVDSNRMIPGTSRVHWRRDLKRFTTDFQDLTAPAPSSQAAEAHSAAVLPEMVVIADQETLKAALEGGQIVTEAKAIEPDAETERRLRRERKEAAGRAQLDEDPEIEEEDPEDEEDDF